MFDLTTAISNINSIATDWQASPSLTQYFPEIIDDAWTKAFAIQRLTDDTVKSNNGKKI